MSEWTDADVETVREALRGAKCTCGHDAEWHSALLGCNAEDYTDPPTACDCTEDWVGAVVPSLASGAVVPARVVEEARRVGAEEAIAAAAYEIDAATSIPVAARAAIRAVLLGRVRRGEVLTEGRDRAGEGADRG